MHTQLQLQLRRGAEYAAQHCGVSNVDAAPQRGLSAGHTQAFV